MTIAAAFADAGYATGNVRQVASGRQLPDASRGSRFSRSTATRRRRCRSDSGLLGQRLLDGTYWHNGVSRGRHGVLYRRVLRRCETVYYFGATAAEAVLGLSGNHRPAWADARARRVCGTLRKSGQCGLAALFGHDCQHRRQRGTTSTVPHESRPGRQHNLRLHDGQRHILRRQDSQRWHARQQGE